MPEQAPVTTAATAPSGAWFGHPRGLATLFFTEMWERFSFYGMRGFLIFYMTTAVAAGGLGFDRPHAGSVLGWYLGGVWFAAIPGGFIADRFLGAYRSVLVGGILIALGHFTLTFRDVAFFYTGLTLIVLGTGLLKPSATTMVGSLYDEADARRDAGFSIFYMSINIGAFIGPLIAGFLAQRVNWHLGFACAGIGMALGLIQYVFGRRHLQPAVDRIARARARPRDLNPTGQSLGLSGTEWRRIAAILMFFVFATLFWAAYEQAASTLGLFADRNTNRAVLGWTIPSSWFVSIQALFVIILAPVFAWFWIRLGNREPSTPAKFTLGLVFVGLSFVLLLPAGSMAQGPDGVKVSMLWLVVAYFLQVCGELCLSPVGNSVVTKLAPARIVGMMMGVWFLSIALGNKIAGWVAGLSASVPYATIFLGVAVVTLGAGLILFVLVRPIKELMGGVK